MLLELLGEEHGELLALSVSSFDSIFKPFQILRLFCKSYIDFFIDLFSLLLLYSSLFNFFYSHLLTLTVLFSTLSFSFAQLHLKQICHCFL